MKTQKTLISIAAGLLLAGGALLTAPAQAREHHRGPSAQVHRTDHRAGNREWRRAPRWEHRTERRAWHAHRHHERRWWREDRHYRGVYYAPPRHYHQPRYRVQFFFFGN